VTKRLGDADQSAKVVKMRNLAIWQSGNLAIWQSGSWISKTINAGSHVIAGANQQERPGRNDMRIQSCHNYQVLYGDGRSVSEL
jgi:hypothetical protein